MYTQSRTQTQMTVQAYITYIPIFKEDFFEKYLTVYIG